jgi:hypothetical protein
MIKKYNLDSSLVNYIDNLGMGVEARGALGGTVYYVEGNAGNDKWDGLSIDKPFKTLAKAISVSNIDINRRGRWAKRNTIYLFSDTTTESLVAFPNKCDVVGCGSYDANTKPGITGLHAPVNTGNWGTRFFNTWFKATKVASPIITLASTSSGFQAIGCTFDGSAGTVTLGISQTASPFMKVIDCDFFGAFATGYIAQGTGETAGTVIEKCRMSGSSGYGIKNVTGTTSSYPSYIKDNIIAVTTTGICLDDDANSGAGIWHTIGNRCCNGATLTNYAGRTGICDINEDLAIDNIFTGADISVRVPLLVVA